VTAACHTPSQRPARSLQRYLRARSLAGLTLSETTASNALAML